MTVFAAVTTFIWATRVPLAWKTTDGGVADRAIPLATAAVFLVPAVLLLAAMASRRSGRDARLMVLARGLIVWTSIYWSVRLPLILLHDHAVGFKVVHSVLAAASVGTAVAAWRAVDRPPVDRPTSEPVLA